MKAQHRLTRIVLPVLSLLLVVAACSPASPPFKDADNGQSTDHGWFEGGKVWRGDFPDPHVVRVGSMYYAYSTPTAGRILPVLTSTDLKTWVVHPRWSSSGPPNSPGYNVNTDPAIPAEIRASAESPWGKYDLNDALVSTARWGLPHQQGAWINRDTWAPGVINIGATWYAYYAVKVANLPNDPSGFGRWCLSVATSTSPLGPFRDNSAGPVQCQSMYDDPAGSIDPYPYRDPNGKVYLLWKAAGKVNVHESSLMSVQLGANGLPLAGAPAVKLLQTNRGNAWEGSTVENPAMINVRGTTYLFYSANWFGAVDSAGHSPYATGYAICPTGPTGPCSHPSGATPLLASNGTEQGPGGASAFVDTSGQLRLAYHSYFLNENRNGFHPRRMSIATIIQNPDRTLRRG